MNVAIVVYSHYSRDARVRRYAESLARNGFEVDVICLKENYQPKEKNISLIMYPIPRIRTGRVWYITEYLLFFLYSSLILSLYYFTRKYKYIHINNMPEILVFSAIIPKIFGAKIILDMHDPMPELYISKYHVSENSQIVKLLKRIEGRCFQFADYIFTANDAFKKIFFKRHKFLHNKIIVILNCPDPKIFNSTYHLFDSSENKPFDSTQDKQFTLLYMGTVEKRFGLDIVLEAISTLIKEIPNIKFIIIPKLENEGKYFNFLKLKFKSLKIEKYIDILKPQPLEKIAQKLKSADIGVVLAQNGVFTENIFPVKLLEFIQMNVPVIATKTKILSQYFDNNSIFFLPINNSEQFIKATLKIYKSQSLRKKLTANAHSYLQKFNWLKEEQKYLDLVKVLL